MKRFLGTSLLTAAMGAAFADPPVELTFDNAFISKYVWRGINLSNGAVYQPSLTLGYEGWNLNFWGNFEFTSVNLYPSGSTGLRRFTEWDTTISYSSEAMGLGWTVGAVQYAFPTTGFATTTEVFGQIHFGGSLHPYISGHFDTDEFEGAYFKVGAGRDFNVLSLPVTLGAWLGYGDRNHNAGYYLNDRAGFADYGIEARYTAWFNPNASAFLSVAYTSLLDSQHLAGSRNRSNTTVGLGIGVKF